MVGGFANIAGGVLAAYVGMGVDAGHLIASSVMSAPASLLMAKLIFPETEESRTSGQVTLEVERPWANVIDAAADGATEAEAGAQRRRHADRLHRPGRADQRPAGAGSAASSATPS